MFGHFVIGVERGDMPRDILRNAGDKTAKPIDLVVCIVEIANKECNDFDPDTQSV